jgi:DNA-nicking Smr family endonuclease
MFFIAENTLDFHNFASISELEIERNVDLFIHESYNKYYQSILIITGKGKNSPKGAMIKPIVLKYLSIHKLVKTYKIADYTNGGEGAVEVWLIN